MSGGHATEAPDGSRLYLQRVPESKTMKNRVRIGLEPDVPRDREVERVPALDATVLVDRRDPDGSGGIMLAGPEGNAFCVVRSDAERALAGEVTGE
ncbi:VOC family protein [Micromonospora chersina]|uniref:VOC family protein n=1 Tax=Micromonospora chersina TaxID=47854 RepID=UPI0033CC2FBE